MNTTISPTKSLPLLACKVMWLKPYTKLIVSRADAVGLYRELIKLEVGGFTFRAISKVKVAISYKKPAEERDADFHGDNEPDGPDCDQAVEEAIENSSH